jgi:hypothetical protein
MNTLCKFYYLMKVVTMMPSFNADIRVNVFALLLTQNVLLRGVCALQVIIYFVFGGANHVKQG